jgi:RimJ/RimL family protein N-acetyltransferase
MIETERLYLRDWTEADIEPFLKHTNTPAVMRWLGGVAPEEEARERIRERIMRWPGERGFTFWAAERKADGELLGFCGLKIADTPGSPVEGMLEVGWRLREDAWGQGYAREGAIASIDFGFARLGAERIVALTFQRNEPSWGLMVRLGMTRRPELDYDDERFPDLNPTIVYDIRPGELRR